MKRSFLMSALVLALASAMAMTACGNSSGAASGDDAKKDDSSGGSSSDAPSSGDPVKDLQTISDNLQKEIDDAFAPIKSSDDVIASVAALPTDLKGVKGFNKAKLMAQVQVVVGGGDGDFDSLKLPDDAKAKIMDRITKLKALVAAIKGVDDTAAKVLKDIGDALPKIATNSAKAIATLQVKIKAPFGVSQADKDKANADMKTLQDLADGFKTKADGWKKDCTDIPAKAKTIPAALAKLK